MNGVALGKIYTPGERILIDIPADGNYIEIMGHRIDGFESFEAFLDYLEKCATLEDRWEELKRYLVAYKEEKSQGYYRQDGRYCVALSIDDILKKMDEIERR